MQSEQPTPSHTPDDAVSGVAVDALQRRRLLLKGLGKGSAVAAVVAPIQSLAAVDPLTIRLCTVSGVQSNVGSGRTGGTTEQCSGYPQSFFATLSNWPGYTAPPAAASFTVSGRTITDQSRFVDVFGSGSNNKLIQVFTAPNQSASEKIWAAALLSAVKKQGLNLGPSASGTQGYFPYTPQEVLDLFSSTRKAQAETFFLQYLVP